MFEYYVLNESFKSDGEIEHFNIFQNWVLDEAVQKEVKKYLRSPKNYKCIKKEYMKADVTLYGFDAFCEELRRLIMWQEWSRCEYEIIVSSLFDEIGETEKKIDCYYQCEKNIPIIAREVIWQYKQHIKKGKNNVEL